MDNTINMDEALNKLTDHFMDHPYTESSTFDIMTQGIKYLVADFLEHVTFSGDSTKDEIAVGFREYVNALDPVSNSDHSDYMDIYCSVAAMLLEDTIAEQVIRTHSLFKLLNSLDIDELKESNIKEN